jgi:hypothetical protein
LDQGYRGDVAERPQQPDYRQPERRSATVVTEPQGMSRSVSVAPGNNGSQGMVVSSKNERKEQPNRLHSVSIQQPDSVSNASVAPPRERGYRRNPVSPQQPAQPVTRINNISGYAAPGQAPQVPGGNSVNPQFNSPARSASARTAPARETSAYPQQPAQRAEPVYQQSLNSSNVIPRAERRQSRDSERQEDRQDR